MREKINWKQIFGTDADLLAYCQRRGLVTPQLDILIEFLDEYEVANDEMFPEHRKHLSNAEVRWLERLVAWRFGYKTYKLEVPHLSYWCEKLHFSRKHAIQMYTFLARQGLLRVWTGCKRMALHFSIDVLLDKVRAWLEARREAAKARDAAWQEHVQQLAAPALEGEREPIPIPFPVPEPEPVPVPEAAYVAAPEWQTIKEQALARTPKGARHWFNGAVAYRADESFVIVAQTRAQGKQLMRFHDLLMSLIEKYCAWCQFVRYDVAARSAG